MEETVIRIISGYTSINVEDIRSDTDIIQKLEISSLDLINIINDIEEEFEVEIPFHSIRNFKTISDITAFLVQQKK